MSDPQRSPGSSREMCWASATSQAPRLAHAVNEAADALTAALGDASADLVLAFVSPHYRTRYDELPQLVSTRLSPRVLLGCSAAGVIGGGRELEHRPGLSLLAARLPHVALHPFHVETEELPSPDEAPGAWVRTLSVPQGPPPPQFLVLADPGSCDPTRLLEGLDFAYPGATKLGGLASDGVGNALFLNEGVLGAGTVGVALQGNVLIEPIVAQGCRPIGERYVVTRCHQNLLLELDGRKPTEALADLYQTLAEDDQALLQRSLHLGVASTGLYGPQQDPAYLIRNILGADPKRGILAIGARLRPGQTVRFHLRDPQAAEEDLALLLGEYRARPRETAPVGAVLFSCAGRGEGFFGGPGHESRAFQERVGDLPLGGFFCAGEIGPVGGDTCLLGYTSAFGVVRPAALGQA